MVWDESYSDKDILGSFHWFSPNTIKLSMSMRDFPKMTVPTLCHELRHMYQYQKYKLPLYILASIPVLRRFTLEKSAWEVEKEAEKVLGMEGLNADSVPWF